ncbi:hypothetical protein CDD83_5283 [Cordyceps sp. RAO-2017]|nr:hypothetical protein CDD83_5283 [Cordyceps sp. RAO-2017]
MPQPTSFFSKKQRLAAARTARFQPSSYAGPLQRPPALPLPPAPESAGARHLPTRNHLDLLSFFFFPFLSKTARSEDGRATVREAEHRAAASAKAAHERTDNGSCGVGAAAADALVGRHAGAPAAAELEGAGDGVAGRGRAVARLRRLRRGRGAEGGDAVGQVAGRAGRAAVRGRGVCAVRLRRRVARRRGGARRPRRRR